MAKSARSSDRKRNNAKLRTTVFGPAHDARTARLSAKLQELAAKPKPEQEKAMEVDAEEASSKEVEASDGQDTDTVMGGQPGLLSKQPKKKPTGRIEKNSRKKARNQMVFPVNMAKRKRLAKSKNKST